ncbi:MAG: O-methyltransferase [Bacteroidia bacterium]|nr:O-methyltransferase [Bacteroidia bacterium]
MNLSWNEIVQYVEDVCDGEPSHLFELRKYTRWNTVYHQMICSPAQGRFLRWLSQTLKPSKILEWGTFTGYSALCLAEGLQEKGKMITVDFNSETNQIARNFIHRNVKKDVKVLEQDIKKWISENKEKDFDLVFIDADKENYPYYYKEAKKITRSGGHILFDNMLWKGWVVNNSIGDASAEILKKLTIELMQDKDVFSVFIPLRDGMILCQKK